MNNLPPHINQGFDYPSGFNYPVANSYSQPLEGGHRETPTISNLNANQVIESTVIKQLLQEMKVMKVTIGNLTLTNKRQPNMRNGQLSKGDTKNINPRK